VNKDIEQLENVDTSEIPDTPGFDKKVRAAIKRDARQEEINKILKPIGRAAKTVGLVIVVGIVALFTMAMAIRPIRTAVWDAVVEWYEDFIAVRSSDTPDHPLTIEEIRFPTYIPEGWSITVDSNQQGMVSLTITGTNDEMIFLEQKVITDEIWIDNADVELFEILLNGQNAAQLAQYSDGMIQLIWENSYVFHLTSYECSLDLVLRIAESIN
jgi:hypothetical protein